MVTTTSQLDEMAQIIENLEGALQALLLLIFILKVGLHQARVRAQTEMAALGMLTEVEGLVLEDVVL